MRYSLWGFFLFFVCSLSAQKTLVHWTEVVDSNDADIVLYKSSDTDKPLNGKFKLLPVPHDKDYYINCELQKGYLTGKVSEYKQGKLVEETNYRNGKKDGDSFTWYEDGSVKSESFYVNGEKNGREAFYYQKGTLKEEYSYRNGQKDGPFVIYNSYNDDKKTEGQYVHGLLDGLYTEFVTDDVIDYRKKIQYRQGEIINYEEQTLEGRTLKVTHYKFLNGENVKDGKEFIFDAATGRKIRENRYKNGKENDFQTEYDLYGNELTQSYYKDGEIQYIYAYTPGDLPGKMRTENFKNGKRISIYYHTEGTGNVHEMRYYDGDTYTGRYETFYPNRIMKEKVTSKEKLTYHENGRLQSRSVRKGGEWVLEEEYDEKGNKLNE